MGNRALLIGIAKKLSKDPSLEGADKNPPMQAELLMKHYGFSKPQAEIRQRIKATDTTRATIRAEIEGWLLADIKAGDVRVLAISSHGVTFAFDGNRDDCFVTSDGDGDGILLSEIDALISTHRKDGRIYCLFDSCRGLSKARLHQVVTKALKRVGHSQKLIDLMFLKMGPLQEPPEPMPLPTGTPQSIYDEGRPWIVLRACAYDQQASYDTNGGDFTKAICNFLRKATGSSPEKTLAQAAQELLSNQDPEVRGPKNWLQNDAMFS